MSSLEPTIALLKASNGWGEYMLARLENGIAVHDEEWLASITRSRGTKAKIRNIMSAVCTHAVRYGWMATNPIRAVRQSAKRERVIVPLTAEELQRLFAELGPRERTLVLLDVPTGMRKGEVLATQWCDIDSKKRHSTSEGRFGNSTWGR